MVVPGLNRSEIAAHADVELLSWEDVEGPRSALQQALAVPAACFGQARFCLDRSVTRLGDNRDAVHRGLETR